MRFLILSVLFMTALVAVGVPGRADTVPGAQTDLTLKKSYVQTRWIGTLRKGTPACPEVAGWQHKTLVERAVLKAEGKAEPAPFTPCSRCNRYNPYSSYDSEPESPPVEIKVAPADHVQLKKLGLDRICIYTPKEGGPWVEFVPPAGLVARQDRLALSITSAGGLPSDALSRMIWEKLAAQLADQTGPPEPASPGGKGAFHFKGEPSVRLTFIDSQPDSRPGGRSALSRPADGSLHGFTLAHFAQDIVCPSGPYPGHACAATVESRRALGYGDFDPGLPLPQAELAAGRSGHVGLVSDLATAIVAEVLYWRQFEPHKHLVLNLSLGWDGESFGDLDARSLSQLEPAVRSVYEAVRFARNSGALVIAAAGNRKGGSETEWPLLPAAWELRRPSWFPFRLGCKPLYAVGGVDWQGLPLPNSRVGGRPRRAAFADHSVTHAEDPGGPTAMYTGTSVSAAVTSSMAAVIWHLQPDLKPAQVMKLMAHAGEKLPFQADFYAWKDLWPLSKLKAAPPARRLSLCRTVEQVCGPHGTACADRIVPFEKCLEWNPKQPPDIESIISTLPRTNQIAAPEPQPEGLDWGTLDISNQRWVFPQPEATPCPGCSMVRRDPPPGAAAAPPSTQYELVFSIGDEWIAEAAGTTPGSTPLVLESGLLEINCEKDSYQQAIPKEVLDSGGPFRVPLTDVGKQFGGCAAGITFQVRKGIGGDLISVYNPVLVDPRPTL